MLTEHMRSKIFIQKKKKKKNKTHKDRCGRIRDRRRLNRFIQNKTNTKAYQIDNQRYKRHKD